MITDSIHTGTHKDTTDDNIHTGTHKDTTDDNLKRAIRGQLN